MRLGILGGSFNPPHVAHLLVAADACEALALDRLVIVPAATQPLKEAPASGGASPRQRLEMAQRAFGGDPRFEVSPMEIERGGLSYTVDTLELLAAKYPEAELVLLLGMDAARQFDRWKKPHRIRELAVVAVLARTTDDALSGAGSDVAGLPEGATIVTTRRVDVSSSEIRERLAAGKSIRGFVAESVERYIFAAKLYMS